MKKSLAKTGIETIVESHFSSVRYIFILLFFSFETTVEPNLNWIVQRVSTFKIISDDHNEI